MTKAMKAKKAGGKEAKNGTETNGVEKKERRLGKTQKLIMTALKNRTSKQIVLKGYRPVGVTPVAIYSAARSLAYHKLVELVSKDPMTIKLAE